MILDEAKEEAPAAKDKFNSPSFFIFFKKYIVIRKRKIFTWVEHDPIEILNTQDEKSYDLANLASLSFLLIFDSSYDCFNSLLYLPKSFSFFDLNNPNIFPLTMELYIGF